MKDNRKRKEGGWLCKTCNEIFVTRKLLQQHFNQNPNHRTEGKNSSKRECPFCKEQRGSNHVKYCKENPNRVDCIGHTVSEETKAKIRLTASIKGTIGGKRHGSGRGKKGWYKGFFCDSSWELAFLIKILDNGIKPIRNNEGFEYLFEGKNRKYYPDFLIGDTYYEIKGRKRGAYDQQTKAKIAAFKHKLVIIDNVDIEPYINYATNKYGVNFTEVYEECKS